MTHDLSDLIAKIDCHLMLATRYNPAAYQRAVNFAIAALNRECRLSAQIIRDLQGRNAREQWSTIRRFLSEQALSVLEAKLAAFVESATQEDQGHQSQENP